MNFKVNLDSIGYSKKPSGNEIGSISNRTRTAEAITEINISALAEAIETGKSFTPAALNGASKSNWISQQILCIDFDNDMIADDGTKTKLTYPTTPAEVLKGLGEYDISPCIMYYSFSNNPTWIKFRVVFCLSEALTDVTQAMDYTTRLADLFKGTDRSIATPERLIFGSTRNSIFYCEENIITADLLELLPKKESEKHMQKTQPKKYAKAWELAFKDAIEYINRQEPSFLTPAPRNKGYICPVCKQGSHTGKGVSLDTRNLEANHYQCFGDCYTDSTRNKGYYSVIDLYMADNNITDFVTGVKEAAKYYGVEVQDKYKDTKKEEDKVELPPEPSTEEEQQKLKEEYVGTYTAKSKLAAFIKGITTSKQQPPISTGFKYLDEVLGGGIKNRFYILGAISSLGKTTLMLQMMCNLAEQGKRVLYVSLEQGEDELMAKSISRETFRILKNNGIRDYSNAKTDLGILDGYKYANYSDDEMYLIDEALNKYSSYADYITIMQGKPGTGVKQIKEEAERLQRYTGETPIIIVDYLQLLRSSTKTYERQTNVENNITELKQLSRDLKTAVFTISSLNRESYKQSKDNSRQGTITRDAFKESGQIEYSADILLGLQFQSAGSSRYIGEEELGDYERAVQLVVLKNRSGQTMAKVNFTYYTLFNHFEETGIEKGNKG